MTNQLNFEELETKTSAEFVAEIKNALIDYDGRDLPIKNVKVTEYKWDERVKVDSVQVYLIAGDKCHHFYYCRLTNTIIHNKMPTYAVCELSEMFNEYSKSLGA